MILIKRIVCVGFVIFLTACASGVTKMSTGNSTTVNVTPNINVVRLQLSDNAKKLVPDNTGFNQEALQATVERILRASNLQQANSSQSLDIEITSFRTRSTLTAMMFGFMAGNDNIEGVVSIRDASGTVLKKSQVTASYALGGVAGGQNETRMSWLYEAFANHVVAEVTGVPVK